MDLHLDTQDTDLIARILADYFGNLRIEISNTDSYDFRQGLKQDEERLRSILARLGHPVTAAAHT